MAPIAAAVVALLMLASGGLTAVFGGWLLTVGFAATVGVFVTDPRAAAAPAAVWLAWWGVTRLAGAPLPQTPLLLVAAAGAVGAAGVMVGQRAAQPAATAARHADLPDASELDTLLATGPAPTDSPSLDPAAEVDEALADLLTDEEPNAESDFQTEPEARSQTPDEPEAAAAQPEAASEAKSDPQVEPEDAGFVTEFPAITEADLARIDDAPLPAATEAGRRRED